MFNVGDKVKVLEPFNVSTDATYTVIEVVVNQDGNTVFILDDNMGGYEQIYLEKV